MNRPQKTESQYHHFIPRFLLRNFAVFKNPGKITPKTSRNKKKRAPAPTRLNLLNLEIGALEQADVAHTFGFVDMYRDFDASEPEQHDLEKRLSRLEGDASEIFRKAKRMQEEGKHEFQLTRGEKDLLRRFIFIMLYRNRTMAGRYEKSAADYDCNDRDEMIAYMKAKGFAQPRNVYFSNIRAFIDVDLSTEWQVWYPEIFRRAYPSDAMWFFKNMQMSYIAFCTPQNDADEFLMTQNVYSIFEGPNTSGGVWTDYHIFAPVSPSLMIITRSSLLQSGVDEDEPSRQEHLQWSKSMHINPESAESCLEDLPIAKSRNNYSRVVNGKTEPLPTKLSRDKHVFYFRFFPLETRHVQKINTILLEEAPGTITLVYKSPESLRRALEFYLTDDSPGLKQVYRLPPIDPKDLHKASDTLGLPAKWCEDKEITYPQLLERVAQTLGSKVIAKYKVHDFSQDPIGPKMTPEIKDFVEKFNRMMASPEEPQYGPNMTPHLLKTYKKLGPGILSAFMYDLDQSRRIVQLVIKSDSMMRMQTDATKEIIRQNRENLISKLPPRRVWLFVKGLRDLSKRDPTTMQLREGQSIITDGVEDAFANAYNVFTPETLSRIMQKAADLDVFLSSRPTFGLIEGWNLIQEGPERLFQEIAIVFDKPGEAIDGYENRLQLIQNLGQLGSICNCGIRAIEEVVQTLSAQPRPTVDASDAEFLRQFLSEEELLELWLRNYAAMVFEEVLGGSLAPSDLQELKRVMFQEMYRLSLGVRARA